MRIEHVGVHLLLLFGRRTVRLVSLEQFALRRGCPVRMDIENLVKTQAGEKIAAALAAVDHVKMSVAEFLQPQGDARHRAHEGRIHHGAVLEIDDKLAVTTVDHLAGELLEITAVEEIALALDFHPNGIAVYSDLN